MKRSICLFFLCVLAVASSWGQASGAATWPQLRMLSGSNPASSGETVIMRALSGAEYAVTPGDSYQLSMQLIDTTRALGNATTGDSLSTFDLLVQEDYSIDVPYLGKINVKGMSFIGLRKQVADQITKTLPRATRIGFTLQAPAQFDVPVFGETGHPGIVTASPLTRVSDVIAMAQGVWTGASIRRIQLVRGGQTRTVDLFLYGFSGLPEQNPFVKPGDTVFVPRASMTVVLGGAVMYPGTYELVPGETLKTLVDYAGGTSFGLVGLDAAIFRSNADGTSTEIDVSARQDPNIPLVNGDRIRVN